MLDYSGYIRVMRKHWQIQRAERSRARKHAPRLDGTVSSMLQFGSINLASRQWDIVQISASNRPGEFKLWLAIDVNFQSVRLRIPREFYLNFKTMPSPGTFSPRYDSSSVARVLPRGQSARHLFRLIVDEALFVEGESHFSSLINDPKVDGAYELQVPLLIRALLTLGSSCALKSSALGGLNRGLDKGFDLADLERPGASVLRHKYLDDGRGIQYHFLFHATIGSRHLIALFSPAESAKVYVVDGARNRQQLPNPARWYAERSSKVETGAFAYPDAMEFATAYYSSEGGAMRQLVKHLQATKRGLNVIALCSPFEHAYYQAKALVFSEFPFITFRAGKDEEASLMWLLQTSRKMVTQYLRLSSWIASQIDIAAHYDVPVGVSPRGQDKRTMLTVLELGIRCASVPCRSRIRAAT